MFKATARLAAVAVVLAATFAQAPASAAERPCVQTMTCWQHERLWHDVRTVGEAIDDPVSVYCERKAGTVSLYAEVFDGAAASVQLRSRGEVVRTVPVDVLTFRRLHNMPVKVTGCRPVLTIVPAA